MFRLDKHEMNHQGKWSARGYLLSEYLSLKRWLRFIQEKWGWKPYVYSHNKGKKTAIRRKYSFESNGEK